MKRLLQVGTVLFLFMTLVAPVVECFDTWDAEGLENDSELPLFLAVLFVMMCMVVAQMIAVCAMARQGAMIFLARVLTPPIFSGESAHEVSSTLQYSPPLRI